MIRSELLRRLLAVTRAAPSRFSSPRASYASPSSAASSADVAADAYIVLDPPPKIDMEPTVLQPRVVIYDGVCHLCHRGVRWVIKADKYEKIKFCRLQSKAAEPYMRLCGVEREDVLRRFLFIEGLDAYYEGSTAALRVASYLPFPYSVLSALLIVPAPVRDAVYDYIAKRRYSWFGREARCLVIQDKELLNRFIDRDEILGGDDDNDDGGGFCR